MLRKEKAKRPPRRLRWRILLFIGMSLLLSVTLFWQSQPKHDFVIYERYHDAGVKNYYLYDATISEEVYQITPNDKPRQRFMISSARDAPYFAYAMYEPLTDEHNVMIYLENTRSRTTREIGLGRDLHLHPSGNYLTYEYFDPDAWQVETRVRDLHTGEETVVFVRESNQYPHVAPTQWTNHSLIFGFSESTNRTDLIIYRYDLETQQVTNIDFPDDRWCCYYNKPRTPFYAPDESRVIYTSVIGANNSLQVDWVDDGIYTAHLSEIKAYEQVRGKFGTINALDWHPNNSTILIWVSYSFWDDTREDYGFDDDITGVIYLALLDTDTGDYEYLFTDPRISTLSANWNSEGDQLLIKQHDTRCEWNECNSWIIYDMQSGNQTILPSERSLFWVGH